VFIPFYAELKKVHFQIQRLATHKTDDAMMTTQACRSDDITPLFSIYPF
jgi:hypothetical protein